MRRAFTLLELLLVLALLVVIMAIAVPSIGWFAQSQRFATRRKSFAASGPGPVCRR